MLQCIYNIHCTPIGYCVNLHRIDFLLVSSIYNVQCLVYICLYYPCKEGLSKCHAWSAYTQT